MSPAPTDLVLARRLVEEADRLVQGKWEQGHIFNNIGKTLGLLVAAVFALVRWAEKQ